MITAYIKTAKENQENNNKLWDFRKNFDRFKYRFNMVFSRVDFTISHKVIYITSN